MTPALDTSQVYTDFQGLSRLRNAARNNSPESLRAVAEQFEALFTQMMLKTMRQASTGDGLFDSDQSKFYQDMFDKQIALSLSKGHALGLGDVIVRQLGGHVPRPSPPENSAPPAQARSVSFASPNEFMEELAPIARDVGQRLGISPRILMAQAALETGWGRSVINHPEGRSSHNLFGIKADSRWMGERVNSSTLEFLDGIMVRKNETFRSYPSFAESFRDYVEFLHDSPRYRMAMDHAHDPDAFFRSLQDAGYATDPAYARKLSMILHGRSMNRDVNAFKPEQKGPLT